MQQLTKLDRDLQDIIIQKIHNCWLEEAREKEKEIKPNHCLYITSMLKRYHHCYWEPEEEIIEGRDYRYKKWKLIWLHPTLDRVLYCLWDDFIESYPGRNWIIIVVYNIDNEWFWWKLLNDNWTSATLRDQSEDTKEKIYQLIK